MKNEKGFTLIELLVVVAIIGILVAIAIPQFATYRTQANNSAAQSQLRTLAVSMEAYFVGNSAYASAVSALSTFGYQDTNNVTASITATTATTWTATAFHSAGDRTYTWSSAAGGLQ